VPTIGRWMRRSSGCNQLSGMGYAPCSERLVRPSPPAEAKCPGRGKFPVRHGYYSLTVGAVGHADATEWVKKAMPRDPIPVLVPARLAVHKAFRGQGLGKGQLKDASIRTCARRRHSRHSGTACAFKG
jgi:GNAT superfamily N-acetyltransferase